MFTFDPTVKAGDLLQILAFLGVGIGAYYGMKAKIAAVAATQELMKATYNLRLDHIDGTLENARIDLKNSATQDMQIAQLREEVNELKHWKGFVQPDGEYDRSGRRIVYAPIKEG